MRPGENTFGPVSHLAKNLPMLFPVLGILHALSLQE